MRPVQISANAIATSGLYGASVWCPLDQSQLNFAVSLGVSISTGGVANYTVQHTFDDLSQTAVRNVLISQAGVAITVNDVGPRNGDGTHGLSVGDYVHLFDTGIGVDGEYTVQSVPSATSYTVNSSVSQTATGSPITKALTARVFPHATLASQTARGDGNYAFPVTGTRLLLNSITAPAVVTLMVNQGVGR